MGDYTNVSKEYTKSPNGNFMVSSINVHSNEISEEDLNFIYGELIKMMSGIKRISNK